MSSYEQLHEQLRQLEPPQAGSFEARAILGLRFLTALILVGILLALFPGTIIESTLYEVMFNIASAGIAVVYLIESIALGRRRPWAVAAARPLLVAAALSGSIAVIYAFTAGHYRIPFDLAAIVWIWRGAPDPTLVGRMSPRSVISVGVMAVLAATVALDSNLFGWGGVLDVPQSALQSTVHADCGNPADGPPGTLSVRYDWSWSRTGPFPNGIDVIVMGWTGFDATGRPMYFIDSIPGPGPGIYPGRRRYPSIDLADLIAAESAGSWSWGVELGEREFEPGHVELRLRRAPEPLQDPGSLTIRFSYIHLGQWHSDAATVTCSW